MQKKVRKKAYQKTVSIVDETAISIYKSYVGKREGFLLESYDKNNGRYVFLGREPKARITSNHDQGLKIVYRDQTEEVLSGDPVTLLKEFYSQYEVSKEEGALPFLGGLVGAFGYDYVRYQEELPDENPDEIGCDTMELMLVTEYITIDHVAETMTFVTLMEDTKEGEQKAKERLADFAKEVQEAYRQEKDRPTAAPDNEKDGVVVARTDTLEAYCDKVEKIKHYIREGHIFQTVLSQRLTVETRTDGFTLYERLREKNPSPYLYYFQFGDFEVIGSSPEMIVKEKRKMVETCPIAGGAEMTTRMRH